MVATTERTTERRGRGTWRTALAACLGTSAVIAATLLVPAAAQAAGPGPVSFTTPGTTTWTVPNGVTSVRVEIAGGAGGNRPINNGFETVGSFGGSGDVITGVLTVTPGEQLTLYVARAGGDGDVGGGGSSWGPAGGGYRAGGSGGTGSKLVGSLAQGGGGGGGASAIVRAGAPVAIAGGGGGAGGSAYCGGNPGGDAGADGFKTSKRCVSDGGDGGRAGVTNGAGGDGGNAKSSSGQGGGGGGGGGVRGGGGGDRSTDGGGGGGGGTSSLGTLFQGSAHPTNSGNGYIVLSPTWASTVAFDRQQYAGMIGQTMVFTGSVGTLGMPNEKPAGTVTLRWQPTNMVLASVPVGNDGTFSYTCTLPCGATATATRIEARFQPTDSDTWRSSVEASEFTAVPAATRTDLDVDPGRAVTGQRRQLTATVSALPPASAIPAGTVEFLATPVSGGREISLGTAAVGEDGRAVLEAAQPHAGEHQLRAVYAGADWFRSSQSPRKTVETAPAGTTTTASVVPEPSVYGQATTVRIAVAPVAPGGGVPTGTVTVDGAAYALTGGAVDVPRPSSDAGTSTVSVRYDGSEDYLSSETSVAHETKRATATLVVRQEQPQSVYGEDVLLQVSGRLNSPSDPTSRPGGAFSVWVDGVDSGVSGAFEDGAAEVMLSRLPAGEHSIVVRSAGSGNVEPAQSVPLMHTVAQSEAVVSLAPKHPTVTVGSDALLDVRVRAATSDDAPVSGTVEVRRGSATGDVIATGTLSADGRIGLAWAAPGVGAESLVAVYLGSENVAVGASAPATLTVVKARSTVTVMAPAATRPEADTVLRARVMTHEAPVRAQVLRATSIFAQAVPTVDGWKAFAPVGRVQFLVDGKAIGAPVSLTAVSGATGVADATLSARIPVGTHTVTARYLGEPRVEAATSAPSRISSASAPEPRAEQQRGPALAATGSETTGAGGLIAMFLISAGALAVVRRRRTVRR